ncbi:MAG: N-acetylmuramoyl-L-alanine amidase [Desulfobacterales bacterium]|nr:N-acetylmuramoyl-L-alanine amidase [Desulfobacterales bacterium]
MTACCTSSAPAGFGRKTRCEDRGPIGILMSRSFGVILSIFFILILRPAQGSAEEFVLGALPKTIVLDPGHGGHETGAKGPGGTLEKMVSLNLARKIAAGLKDHFRVILTRTDDYWLDLPERTAVANKAGADLFVSLHTGAGFLHQQTGVSVFFFREASDRTPASKIAAAKPPDGIDSAVPWDTIQSRHLKSSQELARLMHQYLIHPATSKQGGVQAAPLMVLRGADMPAVLIEPGYLTNPVEEKMLTDPEMMALVAEKISNAIIVFLKKSE